MALRGPASPQREDLSGGTGRSRGRIPVDARMAAADARKYARVARQTRVVSERGESDLPARPVLSFHLPLLSALQNEARQKRRGRRQEGLRQSDDRGDRALRTKPHARWN